MNTTYYNVQFFTTTSCQRCSSPDVVVVPRALLREAVRLTHPDRHPELRSEQANQVTAQLNGLLT